MEYAAVEPVTIPITTVYYRKHAVVPGVHFVNVGQKGHTSIVNYAALLSHGAPMTRRIYPCCKTPSSKRMSMIVV
jgi:hypothetical protein